MAFVIYALPRSRTKWLSRFLTYADWRCGHEEIIHVRSIDDIKSWFKLPNTGSAETGAAPYWRLVQQLQPDIKTIVIRRPVDDVIESVMRTEAFHPDILRKTMLMLDHKLDQIEHRVPNVMSIEYADLGSEHVCKSLFEHCLPYPFDHDWWKFISGINIQVNMTQLMQYLAAFQPQLDKMSKIAKQVMLTEMARNHLDIDHDDGLIIQEESFDNYDDAEQTIREHWAAIGESPDKMINRDLIQRLSDQGNIQVMGARCNGKPFGYLMTIFGPSLESAEITSAYHLSFFASPEFPGLGMKLQRAALAALREKGVDELHFRAGVRGDGSRLGVLYKRLGARPDGEMYKIALT